MMCLLETGCECAGFIHIMMQLSPYNRSLRKRHMTLQLYKCLVFCTESFLFFGMKICEGSLSVVEVDALPSDTVEEIKSRIAKAENCPADSIRLIFMGRLLQNGYPLSYYGNGYG